MRILALIPPIASVRPRFLDLIRGIELAGHTVIREEADAYVRLQHAIAHANDNRPTPASAEHGAAYAQYLAHVVTRRQIDVMIGVWAEPMLTMPWQESDGRFIAFSEMLRVPFIHYWPVSPDRAYPETVLQSIAGRRLVGSYHYHLSHNRSDGHAFTRSFGFRNVLIIPPGIDEAVFMPWRKPSAEDEKEYDLAICCDGDDVRPTPFMLEQLRRDQPSLKGIRRDRLSSVRADMVKSFSSLNGVSDSLASELTDALCDEQLADPERSLDQMLDVVTRRLSQARPAIDGLSRNLGVRGRIHRALQGSETWRRPFYAAYLSRRFKCLIVGDSALDGWDVQGDRVGHVPHYELPRYLSKCLAGLNVSRRLDAHGMNSKSFEIAASGAVLMQRHRKEIDTVFRDGRECLIFTSPDQAAELLTDLKKDRRRAAEIATAASERTARHHRWSIRMGGLLKALEPQLLALRAGETPEMKPTAEVEAAAEPGEDV
jgi:glycosyltransferase involved in cell wall biosynthesis